MSELKEKILKECIRIQSEKAGLAMDAMKELQQQANDYGQPKDRYDAFRNQLLRKRDLFAEQYQNYMNDLKVLNILDPNCSTIKVEFGSIVKTSMQNLFISIGIGKFNVDGTDYFAISPKVPIYKVIEGLKVGDEYMFNNKIFKILELI